MTIKDESSGEPAPVDGSRRRFTQSGLAASGILLTLAAQPVLGQTVCTTPSISVSANLSRHGPVQTCNGQNPAFWISTDWAQANTTPTAKFSTVFIGGSAYSGKTLHEVLASTDPTRTLGKYLVAALLNTRSGRTPFLKEATLKAMYTQLLPPSFYFHPNAGVNWDAPTVIAYLIATQA